MEVKVVWDKGKEEWVGNYPKNPYDVAVDTVWYKISSGKEITFREFLCTKLYFSIHLTRFESFYRSNFTFRKKSDYDSYMLIWQEYIDTLGLELTC